MVITDVDGVDGIDGPYEENYPLGKSPTYSAECLMATLYCW
jgi:hypothetical protein